MCAVHLSWIPPWISIEDLSPWGTAVAVGSMVVVSFLLGEYVVDPVREKVWVPWTVTRRMRKQGYSGPSFSLFTSNDREMHRLAESAAAEPFHLEGDLSHDFMPRVLAPFHAWRKLYGDKFIFQHSSRVILHVSDPEAIKEVFCNIHEFGKCKDRALSFELVGSNGLGFAEQEEWATQRRVVRHAFFPDRSKKMVVQMASWIQIWLRRLDSLVVDNGGAFDADMSAELDDLTKDILARSSFGSSFAKGKDAFRHQENHKRLLLQNRLLFSTPLLRWVPTDLKKEISKEKGEVLRCLREIIQERRNSIRSGSDESYGDDLLGLLLADRDRRLACEDRPPGDLENEDEHITDQCRSFFFAGFDSVHTALSWATVLLGHYTDWQDRIRAEVQELYGAELPDAEQLQKLKQLEMFVEETLRLYSPASTVYREVINKRATLLGEPLPKHLVIMINIMGVHREKEYWGEDALAFKPERFADGVAKASKKPFAFDPFGGGPRICVAQAFALMELKLILAMLLQHFSFRLSPSYRHEPVLRMTLQPRFGVQVVLERLQQSGLQQSV